MRSPVVVSIASADRAALLARRNELVEAHMDLAKSIAAQVAAGLPSSFELEDLQQVAYMGLLHAATRYRPGAHNDTPFSAYARHVIRGACYDSVRRGNYVENTRPSVATMPDPVVHEDHEAHVDAQRVRARIDQAIGGLSARHQFVLRHHYGADLGLREVGEMLEVGKSRASQLHMEAVRELRARLTGTCD